MKKINPKKYRKYSRTFGLLLTILIAFTLTAHAIADEDVAVNLDDGAEAADFFNPYLFARDPLWILLPIFALIIVGLHLMPVPKRNPKSKIDQGKRFFREISGEDKK